MKPYRLKHIPTGLYYKPNSSNTLSKKGKIYQTKGNVITYLNSTSIEIYCIKDSTIHKLTKDVLNWIDLGYIIGSKLYFETKVSDWEKEEL